MSNKSGRKQNSRITENDMLVAIEDYTKEFPNEKINIKKLSEYSGIERHYWYSRNGIREKIQDINNVEYKEYEEYLSNYDKKNLKLPNIDDIVDNNYRSKKRLKQMLQTYFNAIQEFYDSACESYRLKKNITMLTEKLKGYELENEKLKNKIKELKEQKDYFENLYYEKSIRSSDKEYREKYGIKEKIIDLEDKNKEIFSNNDSDLESLINKLDNL